MYEESPIITEEHYKIAEQNGIDRRNVYQRVWGLGWDVDRAITQPLRADLISTEDEFFGGAG